LVNATFPVLLYDSKGQEIYDLEKAETAAQDAYPDSWLMVYNDAERVVHPDCNEPLDEPDREAIEFDGSWNYE
jgi:hypothetical protein